MSGFDLYLDGIVEAGLLTQAIVSEFPNASICIWPRSDNWEWPFPNQIGILTKAIPGDFPYWIEFFYDEEIANYHEKAARICASLRRGGILPHHVTQRGNDRQRTFFVDADYALYRDLSAESLKAAGVACWTWVLMPNHIHLILPPSDAEDS